MSLMDSIRPTTWLHFDEIDEIVGAEVHFAAEIHQVTHSFKYRAATSVVQNIVASGFLAASSGNFGQALACACRLKGVPCKIVMPMTSAQVKIDAVRSHGAEVIFVDTSKQTRASMIERISQQYPDFYVASAYDCNHVIDGNATLGHEILDLDWTPEQIIVPIGGGGLISGIAQALEDMGSPIALMGAEPTSADDAFRSLQTGVRQENNLDPMTLADGARTQSVGLRNWDFIKRRVSKIHRVSEKKIIQAMKIFHQVGIQVEPTGALTLGALLKNKGSKGSIVAVISGANVDADLYTQIISDEAHS